MILFCFYLMFIDKSLLYMISLPLIGVFLVLLSSRFGYLQINVWNKKNVVLLRDYFSIEWLSLFCTVMTFGVSLIILLNFDPCFISGYQMVDQQFWFFGAFAVGVDGISFWFVILTTFIFPLCNIYVWDFIGLYTTKNVISNSSEWHLQNKSIYFISFLLLECFILNVFCTLNLLNFFIFFESILIPMSIVIGIWGPGNRKIKANYYFIFYTLAGSIPLLFAIILILVETGSADYRILFNISFYESERLQLFLWFCFFLSFAIKMPVFPFHIWLPEAHVEAPTTASVILAALLLKLGGYGFIRFIPLFPYAYIFFNPLMYTLGIISVAYASFVTIRQVDLKKIIAYSSVAHMNLCTVGIFSLNYQGIQGSIFLMLSHGIVSSALFFLVGILYDRYFTKYLRYLGGLTLTMPLYSISFLFFSLANLAFPGTSNFIGEFLILIGIAERNISVMFLTGIGMLFSSVYSIWLYNRLCFGSLNTTHIKEDDYQDLTLREKYVIYPLIGLTLVFGLFPDLILFLTYLSIKNLILYLTF